MDNFIILYRTLTFGIFYHVGSSIADSLDNFSFFGALAALLLNVLFIVACEFILHLIIERYGNKGN